MNSNSNNLQSAHDLDPQSTPRSHPQIQHRPQLRRPRGFAATAITSGGSGNGKKERENDKERTKLRERHRRAITSRMLAGLRQYGNFPLPARADMNDVLAALAREAGWTVDADGTTYRLNPMGSYPVRHVESPLSASSLQNSSMKASIDFQPPILRIDESFSPASLDSVVVPDMDRGDKFGSESTINSPEPLEHDQVMHELPLGEQGNHFSGTSYVPVYVTLGTGIINSFCQLVDREGARQELRRLQSLHVDGVLVYCWWGIVEGWSPQKYEWSGYRELCKIIKEFDLKLQVGLAFHECGANESGGALIPLPQWVIEIGKGNQDIFFTDREGRRSTECLSWGIDKERVLKGRTGVEVYYDLMRSFRSEFDDLFAEGLITAVEIGLGASGELKYPSFSERMGWRYPGIGEFQCYDKYSQKNLQKAAKLRGHSLWARGPDNAGHYNSRPHETGFFCERGDYDSYYGRFFLHWYSQSLVDHANNVLTLASLAFEDIKIVVKIPAVYWWYKSTSHAAELTAGYYNPTNKDGYAPLFDVLKKYFVTVKLVCPGLPHEIQEVSTDPEGLSWQVLNSAWERGLDVAGQNAFPCYHREDFMRILETAKQRNDPDRHHFEFFTFQNLLPLVEQTLCFPELNYFIKYMHGETAGLDGELA